MDTTEMKKRKENHENAGRTRTNRLNGARKANMTRRTGAPNHVSEDVYNQSTVAARGVAASVGQPDPYFDNSYAGRVTNQNALPVSNMQPTALPPAIATKLNELELQQAAINAVPYVGRNQMSISPRGNPQEYQQPDPSYDNAMAGRATRQALPPGPGQNVAESYGDYRSGRRGAENMPERGGRGYVVHESDEHQVRGDRFGNYELIHKPTGNSVYLQGDDASHFETEMEAAEKHRRGGVDDLIGDYHHVMEGYITEAKKKTPKEPYVEKESRSHKVSNMFFKAGIGLLALNAIHNFYSGMDEIYNKDNPNHISNVRERRVQGGVHDAVEAAYKSARNDNKNKVNESLDEFDGTIFDSKDHRVVLGKRDNVMLFHKPTNRSVELNENDSEKFLRSLYKQKDRNMDDIVSDYHHVMEEFLTEGRVPMIGGSGRSNGESASEKMARGVRKFGRAVKNVVQHPNAVIAAAGLGYGIAAGTAVGLTGKAIIHAAGYERGAEENEPDKEVNIAGKKVKMPRFIGKKGVANESYAQIPNRDAILSSIHETPENVGNEIYDQHLHDLGELHAHEKNESGFDHGNEEIMEEYMEGVRDAFNGEEEHEDEGSFYDLGFRHGVDLLHLNDKHGSSVGPETVEAASR